MAEIYTQAARVVAWVGPQEILPAVGESEESMFGTTKAIQILEKISQKITFDWVLSIPRPKTDDDISWTDLAVLLPYDLMEVKSLQCLLQKPWFERLWIWQEIRLGSASSLLMCGNATISWPCFQTAIGLLRFKKLRPDVGSENFAERVLYAFRLCHFDIDNVGAPLERLLFQTQHCKCTDPRDRIFALLGLFDSQSQEIGLKPDYSSEPEEVYMAMMLKYIDHSNTLNLMVYCNLASEETRNAKLPTWVPNWATRESYVTLKTLEGSIQFGSCKMPCAYRQIEPHQLAVMGVAVGNIKEISNLDETQITLSLDTAGYFIKKLAPENVLEGVYVTGESMLDAFTKILLLNATSGRYDPPVRTEISFDLACKIVREIVSTPEDGASSGGEDAKNMYRAYHHMSNLRLFTSEEGYMGMAPPEARAGDIVTMFLGLKCAMVLRPRGQAYEVVGPCYIHGFMEGEAFLGPLPDSWERIIYYDPSLQGIYDIFINRKSGETRAEDPRVGDALPEGWARVEHENEHCYTILKNLETEEVTLGDPRQTFGALEERGVELKEFVLV